MKEIISPVDTEDGLFHDGDPSTGTEGTVVSQKWLNPVQGAIISNQQELASVLKEAGIKIDPAKQDQLLAAIKKITGTATEGFLKVGDFGIGGGSKHKDDAYNNVGEIYRVNGASKNAPTTGVAGVVSLPVDGGPSTAYISVSNAGNAWVGSSSTPANGIKWNRVYTDAYKPTASDISGLMNAIYPIGIVTLFAQNKDPNKLFPGTKWKYIGENKTIRLGKTDGSDVMTTGGSDSVTLAESNLPAHSHAFSADTSSFDYGNKDTSWFDYGNKGTDTQGAHNHVQGVRSGTSAHMFGTENVGRDYGFSGTGNADKTIAPYTNTSGNHAHTVSIGGHSHSVGIGAHSHSVSGNTSPAGAGSSVSVANSFIKLMAWYRES